MPNLSFINSIRRAVKPTIDKIFSNFGIKIFGHISEGQYAGTIHAPPDEVDKKLNMIGFDRNPISILKYIELYGEQHLSRGSWFWLDWSETVKRFGIEIPKYQHHITYFEDGDMSHIFIHRELFWLYAPIKHYKSHSVIPNPEWLRNLLEAHGIEYEILDHDDIL